MVPHLTLLGAHLSTKSDLVQLARSINYPLYVQFEWSRNNFSRNKEYADDNTSTTPELCVKVNL